jgi:hypothetical protein
MAWEDFNRVLNDRALRNQAFRDTAGSLVRIGLVVAVLQLLNPQHWQSLRALWLALLLILVGLPVQFYLLARHLGKAEPPWYYQTAHRHLPMLLVVCYFAIWWLLVPNPG